MKILCLHGYGTSSEVFRKQLEGFCEALSETYEYVFVDGEVECEGAPGEHASIQFTLTSQLITKLTGVERYFTGPFYAYFKTPSTNHIREAHDLIAEIIAEEGPFDGVLGFSLGSSLAASILLHHAINNPNKPFPFKFAVFFSPYLAFSPDGAYHQEAANLFAAESSRHDKSESPGPAAASGMSNSQKAIDILKTKGNGMELPVWFIDDFAAAIKAASRNKMAASVSYTDISPEEYPRPFHPDLLEARQRISIPTAHIFGTADDFAVHALLLQKMCDRSVLKSTTHKGGHELPRTAEEILSAKRIVEWVIDRSRL
jgi:pimeloyl-ACP methyl ester carboxylesterase